MLFSLARLYYFCSVFARVEPLQSRKQIYLICFIKNPVGSNLVGASAGHGGTRLFVISGTVVGKHKIKRLSEALPCLFSHLVS